MTRGIDLAMFQEAVPYLPVSGGGAGGGWSGVARPDGRAVRDDTRLFHPLGLAFFWAMQGFKYEPEHFSQNADWAAAQKFDFVRILAEVGWPGREIDPTSPKWSDWADVLRGVMDAFHQRGIGVEITLSGKGTATDLIWLARTVGDIVANGRTHMVLDLEPQNEYDVGGVGIETLVRMATELKARVPNIVALSSPGDQAALKDAALRIGIGGMTWHSDRGPGDYKWRQVRQPYDFKDYWPLVLLNNEPPGPASSVATNDSPLQLAMMRAVGVMCGGAGFVLHTGTGVFGDGRPHPTAGPRPTNFWEIANIDAIAAAVRGIDPLLPDGVENWRVANTGWTAPNPVAPFQPHAHWEGNSGDGVNKAYSALAPDGRWIQMPCGVRGHAVLTASYDVHDVVVYDPLDGDPRFTFDRVAKGQSIDLPGGGQDAMVAYIIHGKR